MSFVARFLFTLLIGLAVGGSAAWKTQEWRYGRVLAEAKAESNRMESARQRNVTEAVDANQKRVIQAERSAAAARSELERLRGDVANLKGSTPADTERALALGGLLADCSRAYQELASKADGHVNDVRLLLDAWPKE